MFKFILNLFPTLQKEREKILNQAKREASEVVLQGKEELSKLSNQIAHLEKKIAREEERLEIDRREFGKQKHYFEKEKQELDIEKKKLEQRKGELLKKFEKLSKLTSEEAREYVIHYWEQKLKGYLAQEIKEKEEEIKRTVEEKAKELLVESMRYGASDYVVEYTLSTLDLPSDEFKGRIIGKEGRNIRSFELATGVEVDLDESGVVKLSSFDPVKREVAKVALERLVKDGRIQPSRIEEVVEKTRKEIQKIIYKEGERLCYELKVFNLPQEIIELLGRFKYRFSFGQNMIQHTLEETKIGVALAYELGADVSVVRLACLLHDIGKVITDKEGSHIQLGVDLLKKYRFPQKVVEAVASHHEDKDFTSVEAVIVYLADAVSGGRPGARREDITNYVERMKNIEDFIKTKEGVEDVSVLQAGREIRVIVNHNQLDDEQTKLLSFKLKEELEKNFSSIPGQIKITAIREFRTTAITRS